MRPVTEEQKRAYMTGTQKYLTLRFSDGTTLTGQGQNSQINEGSMKLEQTLCDDEQIHFGYCNAASFEVQIVASSKRYKGLYVYPTISSNNVSFTLGKFRIENDELTDDRYYRTLVCYDQMIDLMNDDVSDWYAGLNFPMTLKNFRDNLFTYFNGKYGVTQAPLKDQTGSLAKLPNDDMIVQRTLDYQGGEEGDLGYTTNMNGLLMLEKICEINGCFGCINEDGLFEYRFLSYDEKLYPANDLFPANDLYPIGASDVIGGDPDDVEASYIQASLVWQEYNYHAITRVQVHQTANDIGAVVGTAGNDYEVFDNFLVYGMDAQPLETVATNLLNRIKKTTPYTPARVSVRGRPWVQTGDLIDVLCRGKTISFPVLQRTMTGITALKDEYEAKGQEYFTFNVTGTNHEFYGILQKTFEITKNVNGMRAVATAFYADQTQFNSEISQTAEQIQTQVTANYNNQQIFNSSITQRADSISLEVSQQGDDIESLQSSIALVPNQITLAVDSATTHAAIVAKINDNTSQVLINADKINMTGYVTFTSLSNPQSQTFIDGANIKTQTINANCIRAGQLKATNDRSIFNLDDGNLYMNSGDIYVGDSNNRAHIRSLVGAFLVETKEGGLSTFTEVGSFYCDNGESLLCSKNVHLDVRGGSYENNQLSSDDDGYMIVHSNTGIKFEGDMYSNGYEGQTGYYYVTNSSGQTASFRFEHGLMVGTSGF